MKHAREKFGSHSPVELKRVEIESWRLSLSRGTQHGAFRSLRQALTWCVTYGYLERNPSDSIGNPAPKRHERRAVHPFESCDEIEAVAAELDKRYAAIPIVGAGAMLRPEEIFGLDRADVTYYPTPRNGDYGTLRVHQRYTDGTLKAGTKKGTPERIVPFGQKVYDALKATTPRLDTQVLFPAPRGGRIDIEKFRHREWTPGLRAAGIAHRRLYDLRSTGITWMLTAGVPTSRVARLAGNSTAEIESTYDRWIPSNEGFGGAIDGYGKAVNE